MQSSNEIIENKINQENRPVLDEEKVKKNIEEANRLRVEKEKFVVETIKEMRELFAYLEKKKGTNRFERKAFRRRFITEDNYALSILDELIEFYEAKK